MINSIVRFYINCDYILCKVYNKVINCIKKNDWFENLIFKYVKDSYCMVFFLM